MGMFVHDDEEGWAGCALASVCAKCLAPIRGLSDAVAIRMNRGGTDGECLMRVDMCASCAREVRNVIAAMAKA